VRAIPEIKAGIWPIGYDTFNTYAAELVTYQGPLINWLKTANLIYFLFLPFKLAGLDVSFIIKLFGPLLFGGLALSFYYFARYFVGLKPLKAFLATLLIIFQLATLRLSWDLYRNELGLIFLFWALINLHNLKKIKNWILVSLFSILVALSNELVTVVLFVSLISFFFFLVKKKQYTDIPKVVLPLLFSGLIFLIVIRSSGQSLYSSHVIFTSESNYLVWRYVYQYSKEMSYQTLLNTIVSIFWLFFRFLLPLSLYGFWLLRKNFILTVITLWLLAGTFSSLIFAGTGIMVWERWLIMLAFPFAIYFVEGAFQLGAYIAKPKKWGQHFKGLKVTLAVIFWLAFLGLLIWQAAPFLTKNYSDAKPPLADDQLNNYFPRTMVHNSVGFNKIDRTLDCIKWLNQDAPSGSITLVDNRYRGLMLSNFTMDNRYIITNSWSEKFPKTSFDYAKNKKYWPIYLIWNNTGSIKGFDLVHASGNMGIFKAKPY